MRTWGNAAAAALLIITLTACGQSDESTSPPTGTAPTESATSDRDALRAEIRDDYVGYIRENVSWIGDYGTDDDVEALGENICALTDALEDANEVVDETDRIDIVPAVAGELTGSDDEIAPEEAILFVLATYIGLCPEHERHFDDYRTD